MLLSVTGLYHLYGNKTVLILGSGLKAITISCFADFVKVPYPSIHHPLSVTVAILQSDSMMEIVLPEDQESMEIGELL